MSIEMMIIIGCAVVALIIAVILAANDGRPRVTHITRKVERDGEDE
jgi:hypothetical protein